MMNVEFRTRIRLHNDGASGQHGSLHDAVSHAKKGLEILEDLPPTPFVLNKIGFGVQLYKVCLEMLLATAGGVEHPDEQAELARVNDALVTAERIKKAGFN